MPRRLPLLFLVEDNGFAISIPVECQTAGRKYFADREGFPGLLHSEVDGTDFVASYAAMSEAVRLCRAGRGPALVHAHVTRPYSHSLSDDERLYKTKAERAAEAQTRPDGAISRVAAPNGVLDRHALQRIDHEVDREIQEATDRALQGASAAPRHCAGSICIRRRSIPLRPRSTRLTAICGDPRTMVDAINLTLHEEMRRDDSVIVFGEDVADCSREANLCEVKGKGGVFKATAGLQIEFGPKRCFNTPSRKPPSSAAPSAWQPAA